MKKQPAIWTYVFWPLLFLAICWGLWYYDYTEGLPRKIGVRPREWKGLLGVFTSPFFHKDLNHLFNNSIPILILGGGLFFFYKTLHKSVPFWLWIGGGFLLWCFGREGNHIGASGLVYALFSFILVGGILSKNRSLLATSLLSIFLYGSLWWGTLPLDPSVSWEGHLTSLVWGIFMAFLNRKDLPKEEKLKLSDDDSLNEALYGPDYWKTEDQIVADGKEDLNTQVRYIFIPKEKKNETDKSIKED